MQSRFAASAPVPRRLLPCNHGAEEAPGAQRAVFINFVREQRSLGVFPAEGFFKVDPIVKSFKYGQQTINLETGAAVKGSGLASVVKGGSGFRVTFESRRSSLGRKAERTAAVIRRESEISGVVRRALLASFGDRLADEYEGYSVSVVLLSSNPEIPADLISIIAASAAAAAAGLPIRAPFAAARVGFINGQFILNPVRSEIALSSLDLVVAGTAEGAMSAEGRAAEAADSVIPAAVEFAQKAIAPAAAAIGEFAAAAGAAVPAAPDEAKEAELLGKFVKALTARKAPMRARPRGSAMTRSSTSSALPDRAPSARRLSPRRRTPQIRRSPLIPRLPECSREGPCAASSATASSPGTGRTAAPLRWSQPSARASA